MTGTPVTAGAGTGSSSALESRIRNASALRGSSACPAESRTGDRTQAPFGIGLAVRTQNGHLALGQQLPAPSSGPVVWARGMGPVVWARGLGPVVWAPAVSGSFLSALEQSADNGGEGARFRRGSGARSCGRGPPLVAMEGARSPSPLCAPAAAPQPRVTEPCGEPQASSNDPVPETGPALCLGVPSVGALTRCTWET